MKPEIAVLLDRYHAAYQKARGVPYGGTVEYERGWFVFRHPYAVRYRRADVAAMAQRLEEQGENK